MGKHAKQEPRQRRALRVWLTALSLLLLVVLALGLTEGSMHGFSFFIFRATGVGSTSGTGLNEDQGPGQPDSNGHHGCVSNDDGTCLREVKVSG